MTFFRVYFQLFNFLQCFHSIAECFSQVDTTYDFPYFYFNWLLLNNAYKNDYLSFVDYLLSSIQSFNCVLVRKSPSLSYDALDSYYRFDSWQSTNFCPMYGNGTHLLSYRTLICSSNSSLKLVNYCSNHSHVILNGWLFNSEILINEQPADNWQALSINNLEFKHLSDTYTTVVTIKQNLNFKSCTVYT